MGLELWPCVCGLFDGRGIFLERILKGITKLIPLKYLKSQQLLQDYF
jgi:hypothetical protein